MLVASFLMMGSPLYAADEPSSVHCSRKLMEDTEGFTAYIGLLIEQNLISMRELERLVRSLRSGKLINPITRTQKQTVPELHEPYEEFEKYLYRLHTLDLTQIMNWVDTQLMEKQKTKRSRDETKKETKEIHQKMIFHPIPKGEFLMGKKGEEVKVTLTHDIEMMSTKLTQKMWVDVMGMNPSHFKGDLDLPVESITWWSAIVYANKLSEKHGLKPAYDLKGIKWKKGTSAEEGTLDVAGADQDAANTKANEIINKNNPNVYETEGFRLPTDAEAEYVRRNLGKVQTQYHFGDDESELEKYAWYRENSEGKTHLVGEKRPLIIDGNPFYDLHGLVSEWCWDIYVKKLKGGEDPQQLEISKAYRVLRGGSWKLNAQRSGSEYRSRAFTSFISGNAGLRLVRTLPEK